MDALKSDILPGRETFVTNFRINMLYYTKQYRFNVRKMENIR